MSGLTISEEEFESLYQYQKDTINHKILEYLEQNKNSRSYCISSCPKCGSKNPRFTLAGKAHGGTGKQMVRCHDCNKRTVIDYGQLTYYSHQDSSKWDQLIEDTFTQVSIENTAGKLNISTYTVWRMRMKLLHASEILMREEKLADEIEMDEKYFQKSHKGNQIEGVKPRHRGEPASKRGLSHDLICIVTAVQRGGGTVALATNTAAPSTEDIKKIAPSIRENSMVFIDGRTSYWKMLDGINCTYRITSDKTNHTSIDHINNVNSFHSMMETWYENYRGVASKYINRYTALLCLVRKYRECSTDEILIQIKNKLHHITDFFKIEKMKTSDLFIPA